MKRRVLCFSLVLLLIFNICFPLAAKAEDEEYKTFMQGDNRWGNYVYGGGETLASAGCAITSFAILMAYADPSLRDVNTFNPEICAKEYLNFAGAAVYWTPSKGPLTLSSTQITGSTVEELAESVKSALDKGLYIIMWGSSTYPGGTHYSPIVGWDDDKNEPIVFDVAGGWEGFGWQDFAKATNSGDIHVYESSKLPSNEAFTDTGNSTEISEEEKISQEESYNNVVAEWELRGMPTKSMISMDIDLPSFANQDGLTVAETQSLISINDSKNSKTLVQWLGIICSVMGIFNIVYSILLSVAYIFDKSNSIITVSMVSILSLGRLKVVDTGYPLEPTMREKGYITLKMLIVRCIVIFSVGCMLISGIIPKFVCFITYSIL